MTRALQWPLTLVAGLLTEKEKKNPQKNRNPGQQPKHHGYALAGIRASWLATSVTGYFALRYWTRGQSGFGM